MGSVENTNRDIDHDQLKRVLDAALLTRQVFSAEALRGLQPSPDRDNKQLKPSGAQALLLLEVQPGLSVSELAKALSVTQSAMSFATARLLQAKFITAEQDAIDARVSRHELTDAGRECIARILQRAEGA